MTGLTLELGVVSVRCVNGSWVMPLTTINLLITFIRYYRSVAKLRELYGLTGVKVETVSVDILSFATSKGCNYPSRNILAGGIVRFFTILHQLLD